MAAVKEEKTEEQIKVSEHAAIVNQLEQNIQTLQEAHAVSQNNELTALRLLVPYLVAEKDAYKNAVTEGQQQR